MFFDKPEKAVEIIFQGRMMANVVQRNLQETLTHAAALKWSAADPRYLSGVWPLCTEETQSSTVTHFVFFWPRVIESIYDIYIKYMTSYQDLPEGMALSQVLQLVGMDPVGARRQAVRLFAEGLLRLLPAGVELPTTSIAGLDVMIARMYATDMQLARYAGLQDAVTVVRMPHRPLIKGRQRFYDFLKGCAPLSGPGLQKVNPALIFSCPRILHLLYLTLQHARQDSAGTGFEKWGLCWFPTYLLFNIRKAYDALSEVGDISAHMDGITFPELLDAPTKAIGRKTLKRPDLPKCHEIYRVEQDHELTLHQQSVVTRLSQNTPPDYDADNYAVFPVGNERTIFRYFGRLAELDDASVEQIVGGTMPAEKPVKKKAIVTTPVVAVTVNAYRLGFMPDENLYSDVLYVPMTVNLWSRGDQHYITFPDEYMEVDPHVGRLEGVVRREQYRGYPIESLITGGSLRGHQVIPLRPDKSPDGVERQNYLQAFYTLCEWIVDPTLDEYPPYEGECYWYAAPSRPLDFSDQYYDPFDTIEKRVDFLRQKGKSTLRSDIYLHTDRVSRKSNEEEVRSRKKNAYDSFVFWFVVQKELKRNPEFPMSPTEYAKYVCEKWMPWRKPKSTETYLHRVPGWTSDERQWKTAKEVMQDPEFFADVTPFTRDVRRDGRKETQFVYVRDIPEQISRKTKAQ